MVDQIREQIAASDHVEATRHRLENVRWDRIVPLAMSLVAVIFVAAVAIPFVVFAGARSSAVPATREQSNTVRVPSRAPVPESKVAPAVVAPKVVDYPVTWTGVRGFNPFIIPVEEGLYNGSMPNEISFSPDVKEPQHDSARFAWKAFPDLKGIHSVRAAVARDANDSKIVFASIEADGANNSRIVLSVDGETSWCKLSFLPTGNSGRVVAHTVRVVATGEEIRLYGRFALGPGSADQYWWEETVQKSQLPCF